MGDPTNLPGNNAAGGAGNDFQAEAKRLQEENQAFSMMMLGLQTAISQQDKHFQTVSAVIAKGDQAAKTVGDRIAR